MNIGTKKTESFSKHGKLDGQAIKFNEQKDTPADSSQKVRVHFENNSPFLVAERVEREIEISHWGNVAVTDKIWLKHNGAVLKVGYERKLEIVICYSRNYIFDRFTILTNRFSPHFTLGSKS